MNIWKYTRELAMLTGKYCQKSPSGKLIYPQGSRYTCWAFQKSE